MVGIRDNRFKQASKQASRVLADRLCEALSCFIGGGNTFRAGC